MSELADFARQKAESLAAMATDKALGDVSREWFRAASRHRYSYHFEWFGIPIIQFPQDMVALQEIVWKVQPDCVIETGIAHGGSLLFYASLLKAMDIAGPVIGVDVDIRSHNRERLERHPLFDRIRLIEGDSVSAETLASVRTAMGGAANPLVILDSNHAYEHVARELDMYAPLVRAGSYVVVLDTIVDDMPPEFSKDRPWGPNAGPKRAVTEFLAGNDRFEVDDEYDAKLLVSVAPQGFLRCRRDP